MDTLALKFGVFEPYLRPVLNLMRSFIMNIKIVGIDLAKNIFQICVLLKLESAKDNTIQRNYKVSRAKFLHSIRQYLQEL
jgi:hypothetical protein